MKKRIYIQGMNCGHTVKSIEYSLTSLSGVAFIEVYFHKGFLEAELHKEVCNLQLIHAVDQSKCTVYKIEDLK